MELKRLDMNHGFLKYIVRNQLDRDKYDQQQKLKTRPRKTELSKRIDMNHGFMKYITNHLGASKKENHLDLKRQTYPNTHRLIQTHTQLLFNFVFLTKDGSQITVPVKRGDSPIIVVNNVMASYPLTVQKRTLLLARITEEIKRYSV